MIGRGQSLSPAALIAFVAHNGYVRAETVRESGEFAVRGGIIDLFPPGASAPLRVDFFGDEIEEIRSFDPMSQRSAGRLDGFVLKPVSEVTLDPASINRFRTGYRERFVLLRNAYYDQPDLRPSGGVLTTVLST